jgi:hypothetical protein
MAPKKRAQKYRQGYTEEDLEEAIDMVQAGASLRAASQTYNIPKTTLIDRLNNTHSGVQGRPTVLTAEEEALIIEMVDLLGVWGFPFTKDDLRHFVKSYLDKKGVVTRFNDNMPTRRFVATFLGRHPEFTMRSANAIKRSRASLSREEVQRFFDNYHRTVEGRVVDPDSFESGSSLFCPSGSGSNPNPDPNPNRIRIRIRNRIQTGSG